MRPLPGTVEVPPQLVMVGYSPLAGERDSSRFMSNLESTVKRCGLKSNSYVEILEILRISLFEIFKHTIVSLPPPPPLLMVCQLKASDWEMVEMIFPMKILKH